MTIRLVALAALIAALNAAAQDVAIDVPSDLPTRALVPDVYGYSIEPVWLDDYVSTPLAATLLGAIANVTGAPPPIRVGGNTADQTFIHDSLPTGNDSVATPSPAAATRFDVTPRWFDTWGRYFPPGTPLTYTLNLAANGSAWANAVRQARAAHGALGRALALLELGNEIDHFVSKGWRDGAWGVRAYIAQFRNVTGQIVGEEWYQALDEEGGRRPKFQAGVFADPPWVPDQQDEVDDFSIANLTMGGEGGIVEREEERRIIGSYATHLYPQSTCDPARWHRMRLDLLSNHTVLWLVSNNRHFDDYSPNRGINVSQYIPQVAAADKAGAPLVMGETNSVSCSGKSGISDTFGAALWSVDYVLTGASVGIRRTYFHLGARSEYSAFTPKPYELKNESLAAGIRANWYAHYFVAKVVATGKDGEELSIAALPGANSSTLSGYAVFAGEEKRLRKLVLLDMGVWNGTEGLSNNSTLRATDGQSFSEGERPSGTVRLSTPWCSGTSVNVTRLTGPGTNAKSGVAVSGVTFDPRTGDRVGEEEEERTEVGDGGALEIRLTRAEGVLIESDGRSCGAGSGEGEGEGGESAAVMNGATLWTGLIMAAVTGFLVAAT